eukprot:4516304-Pyramimonas_sp.AAC.1
MLRFLVDTATCDGGVESRVDDDAQRLVKSGQCISWAIFHGGRPGYKSDVQGWTLCASRCVQP